MDPKKLFFDERHKGMCVYCGAHPTTRDHVPSRVLLDEPFPPDLPVVPSCEPCNNGFSVDEPYLACLVDCALSGDVGIVSREKVRRILRESPHLTAELAACRSLDDAGRILWNPSIERVRNILLKLARGHAAYECAGPQLDEPSSWMCLPFMTMSQEQIHRFEAVPDIAVWPEIGSRAFVRTCVAAGQAFAEGGWQIVQPGRYRYLVDDSGMTVRIVLSEYLACEVSW